MLRVPELALDLQPELLLLSLPPLFLHFVLFATSLSLLRIVGVRLKVGIRALCLGKDSNVRPGLFAGVLLL